MNVEVDSRARGIRRGRTLIKTQRHVGISQHQHRNAASFQFTAQLPGKGERDIFFGQLFGKCRAAFLASMTCVDDDQKSTGSRGGHARCWRRRRQGWVLLLESARLFPM